MSRSASFPPVPEPKRPVIRARRNTLPPMAPPPRKEEAPPTARRATLPPMPVLPVLHAQEPADADAVLDETQVRPADDDLDASVPGVTEVRSALRFNRRRRIPASELFEASTNKIDRHRLLREAGLLAIHDETTAPTLGALPPLAVPPAHARSTMQVSPKELERVRRLSETLEKDSVPVLELVDSMDLSMSDLVDDEDEAETLGSDDIEAETIAGPNDPAMQAVRDARAAHEAEPAYAPRTSRAPREDMLSDPDLQAFRGNEDWGMQPGPRESGADLRIESGGRPVVNATGETPWLGQSQAVVRFAEESDDALLAADVSFEDDRSPVPDLRPESMEISAVLMPDAPATLASPPAAPPPAPFRTAPQMARAPGDAIAHTAPSAAQPIARISLVPQAMPAPQPMPQPVAMPQPMANMSSGFAPLNPGTKLRTSTASPAAAFVPQVSVPQGYPALVGSGVVGAALVGPGVASTPAAFASPYPRAQESGPIPTTSNDVSRVEKPSWTAPLLFVAVLLVAVFGAYFVLGPRLVGPPAAAAQAPAPPPPAPAPKPLAQEPAPVVTQAPAPSATVATVTPSSLPHANDRPLDHKPAAPPVAPAVDKKASKAPKAPAPPPPAPVAKKGAAPAGPSSLGKGPPADDGPKPQQAPPATAEPALPNLSGLGDVLNGAL